MTKLKLQDTRDTFKPFQYPECYTMWLKHEQSHWLMTEVSLAEDIKDWKTKLTKEEKHFLTQIFRFFTQSDIDVAGGYINNYLPNFPHPEVRMMLTSFAARESIHIAAYSHLIETIGMPETIYDEFFEYEVMKEKHEFFLNEINKEDTDLPIKIAAISAFTEGVALFSSFAMLLNFPRNGLMRGMGEIVQWSQIDETQHCTGLTYIFHKTIEENPKMWNDDNKAKIYQVAEKTIELEDKFIDLAFQLGSPRNLEANDIKQYVRFIADRRLLNMGMKNIFKVKKNPLSWVEEMVDAPSHTNFFEGRSTDYAKGTLQGSWDDVWA